YEVIYEEDTALYAQLQAGEFDVDEDLACAMYERMLESAANAGLLQYEVANFARGTTHTEGGLPSQSAEHLPALACKHNVNYWRGGSFYGLGPSATSYVRGMRTKNWSNTQLYCEQLEKGRRAIETQEQLSPLGRAGETAAFGLRLVAGWPFEDFRQRTGYDLRGEWNHEIEQLSRRGWGRVDASAFRLTADGLRFADSAAQLFLR
ncbi:MAG TPA: coproporphyrinogen III oxidase, partial [Verrucomicrobiae bacterium]|nr:coproporphyrinogen III oxidase [Verrucomicrobiae bacterium]